MEDKYQKLDSDLQTYKKMTISLAKNLDKLEVVTSSIKKAIEGFDGRMLIMAVRLVDLQERIETIDASLQRVIEIILDSGNDSKNNLANLQKPRPPDGQSNRNDVEYEQAISEFLLKLEKKGKDTSTK